MTWKEIPWRPTDRVLRQFAALWLICVGLLAWRLGFPRAINAFNTSMALLAVTLGLLGLLVPRAVRWPFFALTLLTLPIGWAVSQVVLGVLFYGVFTPIAVLFRWRGRDVLSLTPRSDATSYWVPKASATHPSRYLQQF